MKTFTNAVPINNIVTHLSLLTFGYILHLIDGYLTTSTITGRAFQLGPFVFISYTLIYFIKIIPFIALIITGKKIFLTLFRAAMIFGILLLIPRLSDLNPSPIGTSFFDIVNQFTAYLSIFELIISIWIVYTTVYFKPK